MANSFACNQMWWAGFRRVIERWDIDIVAGDFNMALWRVVPMLRQERVVVLVSAYGWCSATSNAATAEGNENEDGSEENWEPASWSAEPQRASATAEPATASAAAKNELSRRYTKEELSAMTPPPEVRSDSRGIFFFKTAKEIK